MPSKLRSKTITRDPIWLGPAIAPGEMLLEEFLKPLQLGQVEAARRLDISLNRMNAAVLDAPASRLGPPSSDDPGRQGVLTRGERPD